VTPSTRHSRGGLEREVLALLGAAGRPMTAGEVLDGLGRRLAYTTVMTTLARLYTKGALSRDATGRAYTYGLTGSPADANAALISHKMHTVLDAGDNRAGVLARFVADLGPGDEQTLLELLAGQQPEKES